MNRRRPAHPIMPFIILCLFLAFHCSDPANPYEEHKNVQLDVASTGCPSCDTLYVGDTLTVTAAVFLPKLVSSVNFFCKNLFDTTIVPKATSERDTVEFSFATRSTHEHTIIVTAALTDGEEVTRAISDVFVYGRPPSVSILGDAALSLPQGVSHTVQADITGTPPIVTSWLHNDNIIVGENQSSIILESSETTAGEYRCIATSNEWGSDTSKTFTFEVIPDGIVTYSVAYLGNGSTSGSVPVDDNSYREGDDVTVKANTGDLVREGHVFAGWNSKADGSGAAYAPGAELMIDTADISLFAQWTKLATYKVAYDGNGSNEGTAPVDSSTYNPGTYVTVKGNAGNLVRSGYTFAGWNTSADGSGESLSGGSKFQIGNEDVTLYAVWTQQPTYQIVYDENGSTGGTPPVDENAYEEGKPVTVKGNENNLTKSGYTFAGWNTQSNGSGDSYSSGAQLTMGNEDVTLYAMWTQQPTYSISYDGNENTGGTPPVENDRYREGATVHVKGNSGNLSRSGYKFDGWNTARDGSGERYGDGSTFQMGNTDITLYAQWVRVYAVVYNGNGSTTGSVPVDDNTYRNGDNATVLDNTGELDRPGYTFAGWNTNENGTGAKRIPGETFTIGSQDVTLYAKWDVGPPEITGNSSNTKVTLGGSTTLTVEVAGVSPEYQWQKDGSDLDGTESSELLLTQLNFSDAGKYRCVVSNSVGADTSGEITLTVNAPRGMVLIEAKGMSFMMGSENGEDDEKPVRQVTLSENFYMDTTEVTQEQYLRVMGKDRNSSWQEFPGLGDNYPCYYMAMDDAVQYCNKLTKSIGSTDTAYVDGKIDSSSNGFRLPWEAEWEYACRAGSQSDFYWGRNYDQYPETEADSNEISLYAVWAGHPSSGALEVAQTVPNKFGLYDMPGNVWEWCNDTIIIGPTITMPRKVLKGGSYGSTAYQLRSSFRGSSEYYMGVADVGFRVVYPVPE